MSLPTLSSRCDNNSGLRWFGPGRKRYVRANIPEKEKLKGFILHNKSDTSYALIKISSAQNTFLTFPPRLKTYAIPFLGHPFFTYAMS